MTSTRREFLEFAALLGASAAWSSAFGQPSHVDWHERRDFYPEGVASGDPDSTSVLLWTRREPVGGQTARTLTVEVSSDAAFTQIVASQAVDIAAESDWTCRVLVGGLQPSREYWYRFTDPNGMGSRPGRTMTAPRVDDSRTVRFAFVSCQNVNLGAQNAYRRMIFDDERAAAADRLDFVLHLGDFIYELVWYPEDRPTYYERRVRDIVRYPHGEKIDDFHIPVNVDDYRAVYKSYLHDPDLQDARARWPFVSMWDNHEFSWQGWQSMQVFDGRTRPAQTRKVAANQAFFEYQPARMAKPSGPSLDRFNAPHVVDAPVDRFDDHGLGQESNNLTAINSLQGYRALRWGRHVELIITDQRSYRSEDPTTKADGAAFFSKAFAQFAPEDVLEILDGGRDYNGGKPPATIRFGGKDVANVRKNDPPQTILGAEQKAWFLKQLRASNATWKIWGSTTATLDMRADPQNVPEDVTGSRWPGGGFGNLGGGDISTAFAERGEIYDFVRQQGVTGFVTVAGDRHSFWAGLAAKSLPPKPFEPVGVAFVTGSISAPGVMEAFESRIPKDSPLGPLLVGQPLNLLLRHGVRACLEYAKHGDVARARQASNPDVASHLSFVDMGGHGYAIVTAAAREIDVEFVCVPRPINRAAQSDGGPVLYRVRHRTPLWQKGETPKLQQRVVEGDPAFSI